jgi:aspartyl-tRNA synthetase
MARSSPEGGDAVFFVAGDPTRLRKFAGLARTKVGQELKLIDEDQFEFCWIVDFPMYRVERGREEDRLLAQPVLDAAGPRGVLRLLDDKDPLLGIKAFQYDIVCNGYELSSGAIRNHKPEIMIKAFEIAGYGREEVEEKFGGMLNAFRYGAPPHGGIAPGIDRIVMLLAGDENIREVIITHVPDEPAAQDLLMKICTCARSVRPR